MRRECFSASLNSTPLREKGSTTVLKSRETSLQTVIRQASDVSRQSVTSMYVPTRILFLQDMMSYHFLSVDLQITRLDSYSLLLDAPRVSILEPILKFTRRNNRLHFLQSLRKVAGAAALWGLEITHDFQQPHIVLLAPHQDGTKQGRRCNHATWSLDELQAASLGCS